MSDSDGHSRWVFWTLACALVVAVGVTKPLALVAAVCAGIGGLLLSAGVRSRRPLEKQSPPLFFEEVEAQTFEKIIPGTGNWYLRFVCLASGAMFVVFAVVLLFDVLKEW